MTLYLGWSTCANTPVVCASLLVVVCLRPKPPASLLSVSSSHAYKLAVQVSNLPFAFEPSAGQAAEPNTYTARSGSIRMRFSPAGFQIMPAADGSFLLNAELAGANRNTTLVTVGRQAANRTICLAMIHPGGRLTFRSSDDCATTMYIRALTLFSMATTGGWSMTLSSSPAQTIAPSGSGTKDSTASI